MRPADNLDIMPTITEVELDMTVIADVYGGLWYVVAVYVEGMDLRNLETALMDICGHTPHAAKALTLVVYAEKRAIVATTSLVEEALDLQAAFASRGVKTEVTKDA